MFERLVEIFRHKEVRGRILYMVGILLIFKFGTTITIPNVDASSISLESNEFFTLMNILGGGALEKFSLFALGVSPYITASIIIQLLAMGVLPKLEEFREQGQEGRRKIEMATRYLTLLLGAVQAYGIIITLQNQGLSSISGRAFTFWDYSYMILILIAGTFFLMWLADQITQKGIGNGVSMIIFAGIAAGIPNQILTAFTTYVMNKETASDIFNGIIYFSIYLLSYLLLVVFVVIIEKAIRKIPIQYSATNSRVASNGATYLPIKVNSAGVIPVIFASSVLTAPTTIMQLLGVPQSNIAYRILSLGTPIDILGVNVYVGVIIYLVLTFAFTFMYASMQVDAEKIAKNLAQSGAYIPGIRPGTETEKYLRKVLYRLTFIGGISLVIISSLPIVAPILFSISSSIAFGGTGIIILIGVALELSNEIEGRMASKDYRGIFY